MTDLSTSIVALAKNTLWPTEQRLVASDDPGFVELVNDHLVQARQPPDTTTIKRAIQYVFCQYLCQAFFQDGTAAQVLAWAAAHAYLYAHMLHRLEGDVTLAADLTQNVLGDVWRAQYQTVKKPGAFKQYLLVIGKHQLFKFWAKQKRATPLEIEHSSAQHTPSPLQAAITGNPTAEDRAGTLLEALFKNVTQASDGVKRREHLWAFVVKALATQPPQYLRIIQAIYFEEKSPRELMQSWQCTATKIQTDKSRALTLLRAYAKQIGATSVETR